MKPDRYLAWDREYARRGRLWGGASPIPKLSEGAAVLELGCGDGKTLSVAGGRGWKLVGLDLSIPALQLARPACPGAALVAGDASSLPFQNSAFDALFAFHVAGHMLKADRRCLGEEAARVLRPGGLLFFRDFSREDMRAGRGLEVEPCTYRRGSGVIAHYFIPEEVADLFYPLCPMNIKTVRWRMRIRGQDMIRAEVEGLFSARGIPADLPL